jgi:hypothetical protein
MRRPWLVPTILAVSTIAGAGSCAEEDADDDAADESADSGGDPMCEEIAGQEACEAVDACVFENADCLFDCSVYDDDEATCNMQDNCFWDGAGCAYGHI